VVGQRTRGIMFHVWFLERRVLVIGCGHFDDIMRRFFVVASRVMISGLGKRYMLHNGTDGGFKTSLQNYLNKRK
jgi:hypothetical protein